MFDRKFLDFILVGEYFILVAVHFILCRWKILSAAWEKFCFFFVDFFLLCSPLRLCPPRCCKMAAPGSVLLVEKLTCSDLPLLKFFILSILAVCWFDLLEFDNEFFSSISRLLLTSSKQIKLDLTIENLICSLGNIRFDWKNIKISVTFVSIKITGFHFAVVSRCSKFSRPRSFTSLVPIIRHFFSLEFDIWK